MSVRISPSSATCAESSGETVRGSSFDLLPTTPKITTASVKNVLALPNAALVRGSYVLVTKDSPSAANAETSMTAPDGYVYVKVTTGISDDDYICLLYTSGVLFYVEKRLHTFCTPFAHLPESGAFLRMACTCLLYTSCLRAG